MVFIGGWRSRRRRGGYGPYGYDPYGYGPRRGYRRGGGGGCLRDMLLLEGGCCLAELLGCGPQLLLVAPSLVRTYGRSRRTGPSRRDRRDTGGTAGTPRSVTALCAAIAAYQREISPHRRACCRYSPTCSRFAAEAVLRFGAWRGGALAVRRILRCRPGAAGGLDPVPPH